MSIQKANHPSVERPIHGKCKQAQPLAWHRKIDRLSDASAHTIGVSALSLVT